MRRAYVDFTKPLQVWDGFGVNYVEAAQTRDYGNDPQDYGGFSTLPEASRHEIIELTFGDDGLRPGLVKMFQDCWMQQPPEPGHDHGARLLCGDCFDHATSTHWMRGYVRDGLALTRARGDDLGIITTLYGPPAWMTEQGFVRGRDLAEKHKRACAEYIVAFAKYLRDLEGFPVQYVSLHNEGEDWERWPLDGSGPGGPNHDYNLYWPPEMVAEMMPLVRQVLDEQGLGDIGVAPGETSNWYRFQHMGYADAIAEDPRALDAIGLISSHGFYNGVYSRWHGDHRSAGIDMLRERKPELHAWVTSTSWKAMDCEFVNEMRGNIYAAKVNAIIPWATVQLAGGWVGGDPNPGTAFRVNGKGGYSVEAGYYFFKQVCRAGQPGMSVARVRSNDPLVGLIAFGANGTRHKSSFVVINLADDPKEIDITADGADVAGWQVFRTSENERYATLGEEEAVESLNHVAAPRSVTTFFGI